MYFIVSSYIPLIVEEMACFKVVASWKRKMMGKVQVAFLKPKKGMLVCFLYQGTCTILHQKHKNLMPSWWCAAHQILWRNLGIQEFHENCGKIDQDSVWHQKSNARKTNIGTLFDNPVLTSSWETWWFVWHVCRLSSKCNIREDCTTPSLFPSANRVV